MEDCKHPDSTFRRKYIQDVCAYIQLTCPDCGNVTNYIKASPMQEALILSRVTQVPELVVSGTAFRVEGTNAEEL